MKSLSRKKRRKKKGDSRFNVFIIFLRGINLLLKTSFSHNGKENVMSQIIACKNEIGIILASDSKAIDFDLQGNLVGSSIKRLCQLTTNTAMKSQVHFLLPLSPAMGFMWFSNFFDKQSCSCKNHRF